MGKERKRAIEKEERNQGKKREMKTENKKKREIEREKEKEKRRLFFALFRLPIVSLQVFLIYAAISVCNGSFSSENL